MTQFLIFSMNLDDTSELNKGRLSFWDEDNGCIGRWVATSGLGAWQGVGDWAERAKGPLPATYQLDKPIPWYKVSTAAVDLSNVKGVEGLAFPITPFGVTTAGTDRADFLIHKDANVPGTSGCIGLIGKEWDDFQSRFKSLAKNAPEVKLGIVYNW